MPNPTRTQVIERWLRAHTHADLADLYNPNMECQVNVAQDGGSRVSNEYMGRPWHGYTDGAQTWKPFRIPWNAATEPEYEDSEMNYDPSHIEAIGMTGWDWKNRVSKWVAFDFDALTGHSDRHKRKMTEVELDTVKQAAAELEWVTVRKSAGGQGLHMYVFLPDVPTENHNEHAALARAILGKMSSLTGFDFSTKVDICGGNMWVYHRKQKANDGLALIKQGGSLEEIPPNWKDHVKVVSGHKQRNIPKFVESEVDDGMTEYEQFFLELTGQLTRVPLDEEHKKLIHWLENNRTQSWWDSDHWMLVTHTYYLRQAHEQLKLKGVFDTLAKGEEAPNDHNCFMFPMRGGGWSVRRYSMGVEESDTWEQDGRGWTRCYFNVEPDLRTTARSKGGAEDPDGGFLFKTAEEATQVANTLGARVEVPAVMRARKSKLKEGKDGRLVIEVEGDAGDVIGPGEMQGWINKKGTWKKVLSIRANAPRQVEGGNYDELVRHIITESQEDYGWVIKGEENQWRSEPLIHVRTALKSMNVPPKEVENILGTSIVKCWTLVNRPFQPEYPGDRTWNRDACQLAYIPNPNKDNLHYPHWQKILKHCGQSLDDAVRNNAWARVNGIETGADYLKLWIACLFKEPTQPLPYLFFYSKEQNTGKSIFHEALSLLITRGYVEADRALTNQSSFNGELKNAIICVVEETDLRKQKDAYARLKNWVTALQLSIRELYKTPYHVPNTTHWIQCANDPAFCPVFPGDSRITMSYVAPFEPGEVIPKVKLMDELRREAPDFLAAILALEIPKANSRLNIEVITTLEKIEIQELNQSALETFLTNKCIHVPGELVKYSDLFDKFIELLDPNEVQYWTKKRFGMELSHFKQYPKGRSHGDGQYYVGNLALREGYDASSNGQPKPKWVSRTDSKDQIWLEKADADNAQRVIG